MGRRGGPLTGVTALGLGLALLTACGAATAPTAARHTPTGRPSTAVSDATLCARIVAHWSREALDDGTYGDYQSMGLSNGQYEILRDVVDAARDVARRHDAAAADRLIDRRSRSACADRYRHGAPSGGPWR
ncbi:hypothetical protein ABZ770_11115 [Streptomyces sp. NPDC006654]|uniref:hypothetical protein n=1 Tax=unclassified Streptomyces TaxID=2593676 RepID=UPI0033F80630